jgi:hypothetical protein
MTRVATIDTRRFFALLLIAAMLIAMIPIGVAVFPSGVLAAATENATVGGSFQTNDNDTTSTPTVSVALYTTDNVATNTMDPTVESWIKVDVTDNQTLEHLTSIVVTMYYDADGAYNADHRPSSADNQTCAILTWTAPNTFSLAGSMSGGTWVLDGVTPTLVAMNTGTFVFHVTPGEVAQESASLPPEWDIYAIATDAAALTGDGYQAGREMTWRGDISGVTGTVSFGQVSLGQEKQSLASISAKYICNGNYSEQIRTVNQWINGTYHVTLNEAGSPADAEFSLKADDDGTPSLVQVTTSYADLDGDETITPEGGKTQPDNTLWLKLGPSGVPAGTYIGNIYFKINNV